MPDFPSEAWDILGASYDPPLRPDETLTGTPMFVLTVLVAGRLWRWATEDVQITKDDATTLRIPGGLKIETEQTLDIVRLDGTEQAISADGIYPPEDVAALVEDGHELDDMPAEVALWYPGRTWEQRIVMLKGSTWLPSYGTKDEAISLTVESPEYQDGGRLIDTNGTVSAINWGTSKPGDRVDGRHYPLVIGRPDWVPATIYDIAGDRAVVAQGMVNATQVTVSRTDVTTATYEYDATTSFTRDSLGKWATTIGYNAALGLGLGYTDTMELVTRWNDSGTLGGGIKSDHGSGYITGLGDVARWAMRRSTVPTDEGRWRALEDRLNRFLVDFWTNDPELTPWQFVRDDLLPLVPVSILHGPKGLYPVWWPYDAVGGANERVAEVDVQASGLQRVGLVEHERRDRPVNEITLEYYPWQDNLWRYRMTYTGRDVLQDEDADTFLIQSSPLRAAFARHRGERRIAPTIQSRAVYQRATAEMVLGWKQYAMSRTRRVVTYDDPQGRWGWLAPGSVVQLVDAELGIDRIAWVRRRAWSAGSVRLQFMLWNNG